MTAHALTESVYPIRDDDVVRLELGGAGPAAEVIINAAREHNIDLIIMGMRGSSNLQAILEYISSSWTVLSRSTTTCAAVADPKLSDAALLYLPGRQIPAWHTRMDSGGAQRPG